MSLINEALKKAQRQRTLESAPLSHAPSGVAAAAVTTHVRAASHRRSYAPVWFGLGLLVLGAGATALIMRYGFTPVAEVQVTSAGPSTAATAPTSSAPATAPAATARPPETEPLPAITLPPLNPTAATPRAPAAPAAPPAAAPTKPAESIAAAPSAPVAPLTPPPARPATPVAPAVAAPAKPALVAAAPRPAPAPTPVAPVAAAPDQAARIQTFLAEARVAGVRGQNAQARVLLNEKVFRLNDVVEPELALRLSGVRPGLLVFTDARGRTYEKNY
jgi:hypothetical protein